MAIAVRMLVVILRDTRWLKGGLASHGAHRWLLGCCGDLEKFLGALARAFALTHVFARLHMPLHVCACLSAHAFPRALTRVVTHSRVSLCGDLGH